MSTNTQAYSLRTRQPVADVDALLTEEDLKEKKPTGGAANDCTTRRRACKNCVCGRAELERQLEAEGKLPPEGVDMPAGGCGNCARGDAFRCANCPYLGKPAWDNTEDGKIKLNLTDDI
ncbi:hypothetical protein STCU_02487 [Strigomonas culicis]|uniref:Anamorsin C-terminal domain-containing protein n=1 Tax=Strigomonas culicis TaxID=28005 RepID=S9UW62_9TRYP|nr:hypothetical protein STCU_02487 [Strigomonas culicis]|eukprot:EPY33103.1 hypothetical protein STCU_02487 [Strigomonas culicis]